MSDKDKWLDGELWNFVRGAALDLEIPPNSPREEGLYRNMKQACEVYARLVAVECRAPAPQWVIVADGEGASVEFVYESDPHEAIHRFMCCCGQSLSECKTPFIPRDVALIDDPDAWSTDESGEKFSVDWPHETGRVMLYKLSKVAATPQVTPKFPIITVSRGAPPGVGPGPAVTVECGAPAPQPDIRQHIADKLIRRAEYNERSFGANAMLAEELRRLAKEILDDAAATPQVTPQPEKCGQRFTCAATGLRIYVCALEKGHEGDCDDHLMRGLAATPQVTPSPEKCPKCGSTARGCTICGEVGRG